MSRQYPLHASKIAIIFAVLLYCGAITVVLLLEIAIFIKISMLFLVIINAVGFYYKKLLLRASSSIVAISLESNGNWLLQCNDDPIIECYLSGLSFASNYLLALKFLPLENGVARLGRGILVIILKDMQTAEDFRSLHVVLVTQRH